MWNLYFSVIIFFIFNWGFFNLFCIFCIIIGLLFIILIIYLLEDTCNVIIPLKGSIGHTEINLCLLLHISIIYVFRYFHGSVEMFCTCVIISLLGKDLTELHVCTTLSFSIFKLIGKFKVSLHEHLHLILVHLSINFVSTHFTKITYGYRLASDTTHLNGITESKLMIDG